MKRKDEPIPMQSGQYFQAGRESLKQRGFGDFIQMTNGQKKFEVDMVTWMFEITRAVEQLHNEKRPGWRLEHPFKKNPDSKE